MHAKSLLVFPLVLSASLLSTAQADTSAPVLKANTPIQVSADGKSFDLLAVDPAHHRLLAAHSQAGTLSIVDTATGKLEKEIAVGDKPSGVAVDAQDGKYFVGTLTGVTFIDSKSLEKAAFVATSGPTDAMVYAGGRLYVGHDDGSELWVIDVKTAKLTGSIAIPGVPEIADADGKYLYQNIKDKDEVAVIDLGSGKVTATWPTPATDSPHGLALDAKGGRLYITGHSAKVSVFSLDGKALPGIDIGDGRSDQTALDLGLGRLYIPSSGKLVAVQTRDGKVLGSVTIPQGTHSVAVDPATHLVWIAYADDKASYVQAFAPATP
ncbi:MAG TPA: YncE family protein [Gammaproteobacteria bacterium]|jgi:YVTN family beta-propeller protein